jgi:uncharacterized membrane protein
VPKHREVNRLEGFSDAIFAIALALLVVSLEVPKTFDELSKQARGFVPFALMFAMVCWVWYEHNKFFRRYGLQDAWTAFLNSVLMFVILFYVYPLKFLTTWLLGGVFGLDRPEIRTDIPDEVRTLMLLYSTGVLLIFGLFVLLYLHAGRRRAALALSPAEEVQLRFGRRAHLLSCTVAALSIAIVFSGIPAWIGGVIYGLMGPLHGWNGYRMGKALDRFPQEQNT